MEGGGNSGVVGGIGGDGDLDGGGDGGVGEFEREEGGDGRSARCFPLSAVVICFLSKLW